MRKSWTEIEDALVLRYYPDFGPSYIAEEVLPERTFHAIKNRAVKLGVKRNVNWYEDWEIDVIKSVYPEWGADKCSQLLPGRSVWSIHKKAESLGVKCDLIKQRINLGLRTHDMPKGFYKDSEGYWIYSPTGRTEDRILYHRYVMEKHLGRRLRPDEIVHHIDEDKTNNRIENLQLTNRSEHARIHSSLKRKI